MVCAVKRPRQPPVIQIKAKRKRFRPIQIKGIPRESNPNDFISQMPDEILHMILCRLPIEDAVVTGCLSTRWVDLWCDLDQFNFDDSERLCEQDKFIDKVTSVIQNPKIPMVQCFRVHSDHLGYQCQKVIDNWLKVAVKKKVALLELDFGCSYSSNKVGGPYSYRWLSSNSLKRVFLKGVTVVDIGLQSCLKNSPLLETLSLHNVGYYNYINLYNVGNFYVGGWDLNLKHLEVLYCFVDSIHLYSFDLLSFTYEGTNREISLTDLPKLKECKIDIERGYWLENNFFSRISLCLSYIQVLSLDIGLPQEKLKLNSIPFLPNVKNLRLTFDVINDDSLLEYTNLAKACPTLETFTVKLLWTWSMPLNRRRKVRHAANHPHNHLKILELLGYCGRMSDLELAVYVIENAVGLNRILIDPRKQSQHETTFSEFSKNEKAARSSAKPQLEPILPPGVELIIL